MPENNTTINEENGVSDSAQSSTSSTLEYDASKYIDVENMDVAASMLDKLSRINNARRVKPLDINDNIPYRHRQLYGSYNLRIGDSVFMIPPEFIMVTSEASTQVINTLRQENSQKMKSGYHKRTLLIDLVFNGLNQLNGYPVDGPEGTYYVDGLRSLLAQFKCTPFLPIINEYINTTFFIYTVALQSITISTINGFPDVMKAQLTLQEATLVPYIELPNILFMDMIDWDLFRFYYQRFLTDSHVYKKLQALPSNKEHNHFRISILNPSIFDEKNDNGNQKISEYNFIDIVTDKYVIAKDENGEKLSSNFITFVDSNIDDCVISSFQCGYSNLLANVQMSEVECPTVQFMGGMDTIYNISFETKDKNVIQSIEQCQVTNDFLTRNNAKLRSLGFVKLESELVEFTGSLFVTIDSVTSNTVPGFTDLYNVQINCIALDIMQSEREDLHGFMPFECNEKQHPHTGHEDQAISQSSEGLMTKTRQDLYAEWKIRTTMEIYPDMHLPTYAEVNEFISKCALFRSINKLSSLPYTTYPTKPFNKVIGNNPNDTIVVDKDHFYPSEVNLSNLEYNVFVDPDFYVFYFNPYQNSDQATESENRVIDSNYWYEIPRRQTVTKSITAPISYGSNDDDYSSIGGYDSNLAEKLIAKCKTVIGHDYVWGAEGEISTSKGIAFDCSGLIYWGLKSIGVNMPRGTVETFVNDARTTYSNVFQEVPWEQRQRGDIVCFQQPGGGEFHHMGLIISEGENKEMLHAGSSSSGVCYSTSASNYWSTHPKTCFRFKAQSSSSSSTFSSSNSAPATESGTESQNEQKIWACLKSIGLSDIAAAGVMGNMYYESNYNPTLYEAGKNRGYSAGYGLIQWTNTGGGQSPRRENLFNYYGRDESKYSTIENQIAYLQYEMTSNKGYNKYWQQILNATTVDEAADIFLRRVEIPDGMNEQAPKRIAKAQDVYNRLHGTMGDGTVISSSGNSSVAVRPDDVITESEFDLICRTVHATTYMEDSHTILAVSQVIYDMYTDSDYSFGDLDNILSSNKFKQPSANDTEMTSFDKELVKDVFCNGKKVWADKRALDLLPIDPSDISLNVLYKDRNQKWQAKLGDIGQHTFWGRLEKSSTKKFRIVEDSAVAGMASRAPYKTTEVTHEQYTYTLKDAKYFGEPTIVRTKLCKNLKTAKKEDTVDGLGSGYFYASVLNDDVRRYNSAFCDMYQYSAKGTLLRAFPAFLFCILDDQCQWYDARKLWTNYYVYKSVVDISVHEANDMPIATANIVITNVYHNLDRPQSGMSDYSVENDEAYSGKFGIPMFIYKNTGLMPGGLKLTNKLIEMHQIIYQHAKLREGSRVHLRMGYGSDPLSLSPVINGHISDVTLGDQINIVVTSDGNELINHVVSSKEKTTKKDVNNGLFGLFGLFEDQESSNIIANIMCEREHWVNHLMILGANKCFEGSKYGIEHYGLFEQHGISGNVNKRTQYDILKNIYVANYSKQPFVYSAIQAASTSDNDSNVLSELGNAIKQAFGGDGEKNVVFNQYNMTPWDIFQVCTQQVPEYICKTTYHQFDSRLYFGLPFWMEKNRYDIYNYHGTSELFEECKTASQIFYCDSITNIIDDQVRVTSKFSNTNVKVMYTLGKTVKSTDLLKSDVTIDFAYQKTAIIDSPIVQDYLFADSILEKFTPIRTGYDSACRIGISNLLYGWQQQYQGQLIMLGTPGIKANDHLMVNDTFSNLYGISIAREVIHSFSSTTGYTTSVTPGMLSFSTSQNSGLLEQQQNYLVLLNAFACMAGYRKNLIDGVQRQASILANLYVLIDEYKSAITQTQGWGAANKYGVGPVAGALKVINIVNTVRNIYKAAKVPSALLQATKTLKTAITAFKAAKTVKNIGEIFNAAKNVVSTVGKTVTGPHVEIWIAIQIAIYAVDILVRDLFNWLSHRHLVVLLPMYWENYPFVSGVKGGENILAMGSNATATNEVDHDQGAIEVDNTYFD